MNLNKLFRPVRTWLENAWYWFRCHTFNRYHMVDTRHSHYKWGYQEPSELILYACFALLVRFVEKNKPFKFHFDLVPPVKEDWQYPEDYETLLSQHKVGVEIQALYDWWTKDRLEEWNKMESYGETVGYCNENYFKASANWYNKEDEMLNRLIKIRNHLWT